MFSVEKQFKIEKFRKMTEKQIIYIKFMKRLFLGYFISFSFIFSEFNDFTFTQLKFFLLSRWISKAGSKK